MTYPPARYSGNGSRGVAVFMPATRAPDLEQPGGGAVHYLATGGSKSGDFGLCRWEMGGEPSGPAPHFHRTMTESFYVLSGTGRLFDGDRWLDGRPGDFLFVPTGGVHAFRNESGVPASILILFTPGSPRERYFEELVRMATAGEALSGPDMTAFLAGHDQYMV